MRQDYPNFRKAQRQGGPYRKGQKSRPKTQTYLATVLILSGVAAFVTWHATPHIQSIASSWSRTPEEIAAIEASVYYSGCDEARSRGVGPIYSGQPGYREGMDGDGDGIACEPYRR